ncbi:MAG: hypothetical protein ABSH52_09450 [Terriglobia bacterium]
MVFRNLPPVTRAEASLRFRIRSLGAGDPGAPGRTPLRAHGVGVPHWHAIFYPRSPLTISRVMEATKDGATKRINRSRGEVGRLLEARFFDRALRTVHEYNEKVQYIHLNPVRARPARHPEAVARTTASVVRGFFNRRTADRKNGGPRYPLDSESVFDCLRRWCLYIQNTPPSSRP